MARKVRILTVGVAGVLTWCGMAGCANTSGQAVSSAESQLMLQTASQPKPINAQCPVYVAKKINPDVKALRYKGRLVGFSSPQAKAIWKTWPTVRRDAFVNRQLAIRNGNPTNLIAAGTAWESQPQPLPPPEMHTKDPQATGGN